MVSVLPETPSVRFVICMDALPAGTATDGPVKLLSFSDAEKLV
jgi:hypothetical protein